MRRTKPLPKTPHSKLDDELRKYHPLIEGVVELFHPFVEAAVHDLKKGKLVMLYNNLSKRKIGDSTPIHEFKVQTERFPDTFSPYYKKNWDGRQLKCTSITVRDPSGAPIGLICFNFDTTFFQGIQTQIEAFLRVGKGSDSPIDTFGENWQKQVSDSIFDYLTRHHLSLEHLSRSDKKQLVKHLYEIGIFNFKNAPVYVAEKLHISRASIYNYLG